MTDNAKATALLQDALRSNLANILQRKKQLTGWKEEYESLLETLRTLPEKITHKMMVPMGPQSVAFMPGMLRHTNEIYCPLGQNYFVLCSASHARSILHRKVLYVTEQLEAAENELESICARLTADELNQGKEEVEKVGNAELVKHGEFVEIRELQSVADIAAEEKAKAEKKKNIVPKESTPAVSMKEDEELDSIFQAWEVFSQQEADSKNPTAPATSSQSPSNSGSDFDDPSTIFSMHTPSTSSPPTKETELKSAMKKEGAASEAPKSVQFTEDTKEASQNVPKAEPISDPTASPFTGLVVEKNTSSYQLPEEAREEEVHSYATCFHSTHQLIDSATVADNSEAIQVLHEHARSQNDEQFLCQQSTDTGWTALHCAAGRGALKVLQYLIRSNVDLNQLDRAGQSALFSAVHCDQRGALEILLHANADLTIQNHQRRLSVLHMACGKSGPRGTQFARMILAHAKARSCHHRLLKQKNIRGYTPLFSSVLYTNLNTLKLLLENNARINDRDNTGGTILFEAVRAGNSELVQYLLTHDVLEVNLRDKDDRSALSFAQQRGHTELIRLLQQAGAIDFNAILLTKRKRGLEEEGANIEFCNLQVLEKVGSGSFGRVHRGKWLGVDVAIKFFTQEDAIQDKSFTQEIDLLKSLNHPNIVNCYGQSLSHNNERCIVMEYLPYTLLDVILSQHPTEKEIVQIMKGVASGMRYLHHRSILHRDLKPSNILLNSSLEPKIADFGISREYDEGTMTSIGTPLYMAPETINRNHYNSSADIYSFGLILLQMFSKKKLFHEMGNKNLMHILFEVAKKQIRPRMPENVPSNLAKLIEQCWDADPEVRPSAADVCTILESHTSTPPGALAFSFASQEDLSLPPGDDTGKTIAATICLDEGISRTSPTSLQATISSEEKTCVWVEDTDI